MGIINHNAVIATTWNKAKVEAIQEWIKTLPKTEDGFDPQILFQRVPSWTNGYITIILAPDGSKEGWKTSDQGDRLRNLFIERIEQDAYSDGSNSWNWIEVSFGEFGCKVIRSNCTDRIG